MTKITCDRNLLAIIAARLSLRAPLSYLLPRRSTKGLARDAAGDAAGDTAVDAAGAVENQAPPTTTNPETKPIATTAVRKTASCISISFPDATRTRGTNPTGVVSQHGKPQAGGGGSGNDSNDDDDDTSGNNDNNSSGNGTGDGTGTGDGSYGSYGSGVGGEGDAPSWQRMRLQRRRTKGGTLEHPMRSTSSDGSGRAELLTQAVHPLVPLNLTYVQSQKVQSQTGKKSKGQRAAQERQRVVQQRGWWRLGRFCLAVDFVWRSGTTYATHPMWALSTCGEPNEIEESSPRPASMLPPLPRYQFAA